MLEHTSSYVRFSGPRILISVSCDFASVKAWNATLAISSALTNGMTPSWHAVKIFPSCVMVYTNPGSTRFSATLRQSTAPYLYLADWRGEHSPINHDGRKTHHSTPSST